MSDPVTVKNAYEHVEHMRILVCRTCRKLEELPDFQGHPEDDVFLNYVVMEHPDHMGQLFRLPIGIWLIEEARNTLIKQLTDGSSGLEVFNPGHYAIRNTFQEDAAVCFKAHRSPKEGCPEFRSDKKKLFPDTAADRKEAGLSTRERPNTWLCDFCPCRMFYENKANQAKGL